MDYQRENWILLGENTVVAGEQTGTTHPGLVSSPTTVGAMQRLWPQTPPEGYAPAGRTEIAVDDVRAAIAAEDRSHADGRPWVTMVMISSLDGAAVLEGLSGGLGRPADKAVFGALRASADAIIVAGTTAMAEDYGPPLALRPEEVAVRRTAGRTNRARLVVMSTSLPFVAGARMFGDPAQPPVIHTSTTTPIGTRESVAAMGAEVIALPPGPDGWVSPAAVVSDLRQRGMRRIMLEGGPTLNTSFLAAGLVDEVHLSLAPLAVAGAGGRIAGGPHAGSTISPIEFELVRVWSGDGLLFLRYLRQLPTTNA